MEQTAKKRPLIAGFDSKEQATKAINHISKVCIILGIIQMLYGFSNDTFPTEAKIEMSVIAIVLIGLGILLKKFKKPIIAKILLSLSIIWVIFSAIGIFGVLTWGADMKIIGNPILGIAMIVASIQATKAISKYNEEK